MQQIYLRQLCHLPLYSFVSLLGILLFPTLLTAQNCSVNAGVDETFCYDYQFRLTGNGSSANTVSGSTLWQIVSQPAGAAVVIDDLNAFETSLSGTIVTGEYIFSLQMECADGSVPIDYVTLTLAEQPETPIIYTTELPGCYTGGGITIQVSDPGAASFSYLYRFTGLDGSISKVNDTTYLFTPDSIALDQCYGAGGYSTRFRYRVYNSSGTCYRTTYESLSFTHAADQMEAVAAPLVVCSSTELFGSCSAGGLGTWTYSGPGTATFAQGANVSNTRVSVDIPGNYTFYWTVNGTCRTGVDSVTVSFNDCTSPCPYKLFADAGADISFCGDYPASLALNGSPPTSGQTGTWTQIEGTSLTIDDVNDPYTSVSGASLSGGPYQLLWTISEGTCYSQDTVEVVAIPEWDFYNYPNTNCDNDGFSNDNYLFRVDNFPFAAFSLMDSITFTVLLKSAPVAALDSNRFLKGGLDFDAYLTSYGTRSLDGDGDGVTTGDSIQLGVPLTFALTIPDLISSNDPENYFGELLDVYGHLEDPISGTYEFEITLTDFCGTHTYSRTTTPSLYGALTMTAGTDQLLDCNTDSTSLAGAGLIYNSYHVGRWTMISGPGPDPLTETTRYQLNPVIANLVEGTYEFRYERISGTECGYVFDEVKVIVSSTLPSGITAALDQSSVCSGGPAILLGELGDNSTLQGANWTQISPAQTSESLSRSGAGSRDTLTITGLLPNTTYTFRLSVSNDCGTTTADVSFTTTADAGPSLAYVAESNVCLSTETTYALTANPISSGMGTWSIVSQPSGATAGFVDANSPTTTLNNLTVDGTYLLQWQVANGGCAATSTDYLTISRGSATAPAAGTDQQWCGVSFPYVATMAANSLAIPSTGTWRWISGPAAPTINAPNSPTSTISFPIAGEYQLAWESAIGGCDIQQDFVIISLGAGAPTANAGPDQNGCGATGLFTLDALDLGVGEVGGWSVSAATGNVNATFEDASDPNTQVTLSGSGDITLRWTTQPPEASCPVSSDEMTIRFSTLASAGPDQALCGATSAYLEGNGSVGLAGATHNWTLISGPNTPGIADNSSYKTLVSSLVTGTYTFQYTYAFGTCSSSDTVSITINDIPVAMAGVDMSFCPGEMITLSGNNPGGGTFDWQRLQGPGGGTYGDSTSQSTTYGPMVADSTYTFRYQLSQNGCSSYDWVRVFPLNASQLSLIGTDPTCGNADGAVALTLNGSSFPTLTFNWSNGATTEDLSGVIGGEYLVEISHPAGCSLADSIILTQTNGPISDLVDLEICPNDTLILRPTVSGGTGPYSLLWSDGSTADSLLVVGTADQTIGLTITDNTGCVNYEEVMLDVQENTVVANSGDFYRNCSGGVTLSASVSPMTNYSVFYYEGFEGSVGAWTQNTDDDYDWRVDANGTGSIATGPSEGANGREYYVYFETSSPVSDYDQAILTSPAFDLTSRTRTTLIFSYHMYGATMGTMSLEVSTDGGSTWPDTVWSRSGDQGDVWYQDTLDLSAYDGQGDVRFRFVGTAGTSYTSDMTFDELYLAEDGYLYTWSTGATGPTPFVNPTTSTDYAVSITDPITGCTVSDTAKVSTICTVELGDYVWADLDEDGVQDLSENGINGLTVNLYQDANQDSLPDGGLVATTTTATSTVDGFYQFTGLTPDYYVIEVIRPIGYVFSPSFAGTGTDSTNSKADPLTGSVWVDAFDQNRSDIDIGLFQTQEVGNRVWLDTNGDGIQDGGEAGLDGITVNLYLDADQNGLPDGSALMTTVSSSGGIYQFIGMPPGDYVLEFVPSGGYLHTQYATTTSALDSDVLPNSSYTTSFSIALGGTNQDLDAGFYQLATIGNFLWEDDDWDGVQDPGESGIDGREIYLYADVNADGVPDGTPLDSVLTSGGGNFSFSVQPGSYLLAFEEWSSYRFTQYQSASSTTATDSDADLGTGYSTPISLSSGEVQNTWDVGVYRPARMYGWTWRDGDHNGIQDGIVYAVAGQKVILYADADQNGAPDGGGLDSMFTDGAGFYLFNNLTPGGYVLQFVPKPPYALTYANVSGATAMTDSDANEETGLTGTVVVTSGQTLSGVDAGLWDPVTIGGRIWEDLNGNGLQDPGEPNITGLTLALFDTAGNPILSDLNGSYQDDFDLTDSYAGSNGSTDWSAEPWEELDNGGGGAGPGAGRVEIVSDDSRTVLKLNGSPQQITRPLSLTEANTARLDFLYRRNNMESGDIVTVSYFDGLSWQTLTQVAGTGSNTTDPTYQLSSNSLPTSAEAIRLATSGLSNSESFFVDSLVVNYTVPYQDTVTNLSDGTYYFNETLHNLSASTEYEVKMPLVQSAIGALHLTYTNRSNDLSDSYTDSVDSDADAQNGFGRIAITTPAFGANMNYDIGLTNQDLPVDWLSLNAELIHQDAMLNWITASETNSDYFIVERSLDGTQYRPIGKVAAAGEAEDISVYAFRDEAVHLLGVDQLFYRLEQVDYDGASAYSEVVDLALGLNNGLYLQMYPNPAEMATELAYASDRGLSLRLKLLNSLGQEMQAAELSGAAGTYPLDLSRWPAGIYYATLSDEEQSLTLKFVVQ